MRILLLHNYYQFYGGEDTYVKSLKQLLEQKGHSVFLFTKDSKNIKTIWDKAKTAAGLFTNSAIDHEIRAVVQAFKPDISHCQNIFPLITPQSYKTLHSLHIPIVQRISNYRYLCPKGTLFRDNKICDLCVRKRFAYPAIQYGCYHDSRLSSLALSSSLYVTKLQNTLSLVNAFMFPSTFIQEYHKKHLNIPVKKMHVIPTFTTLQNTYNTECKKRKNFVYIGRLSEEKGVIPLLTIFSKLPTLHLTVIGDGPLYQEVKKYAKYPNITIKGPVKHVEVASDIYHAIAVIIPSLWYDVFPNVVLEANAMHTPVIAPQLGSFPEYVVHNKNGLLYKANDFKNLSETIKLLALNEDMQTTMERYINSNTPYTPESHYTSIMDLYTSLTHKN